MVYVGTKNRLSKELVPIIQSYIKEDTVAYIEPFVGGANIIDKIEHDTKIGYDIHPELIGLLLKVQKEGTKNFPTVFSKETYDELKKNPKDHPAWLVGLYGFCTTFSSRYFGWYVGDKYPNEITRRIANLEKQSANLKGIQFFPKAYQEINPIDYQNVVFYCDSPYKNTMKYEKQEIDYEHFYTWCHELAKKNTVLVSEYNMPNGFKCIYEKETRCTVNMTHSKNQKRADKLFLTK